MNASGSTTPSRSYRCCRPSVVTSSVVPARAAGRTAAGVRLSAQARPSAEATRGSHPPPSVMPRVVTPSAGSSRTRIDAPVGSGSPRTRDRRPALATAAAPRPCRRAPPRTTRPGRLSATTTSGTATAAPDRSSRQPVSSRRAAGGDDTARDDEKVPPCCHALSTPLGVPRFPGTLSAACGVHEVSGAVDRGRGGVEAGHGHRTRRCGCRGTGPRRRPGRVRGPGRPVHRARAPGRSPARRRGRRRRRGPGGVGEGVPADLAIPRRRRVPALAAGDRRERDPKPAPLPPPPATGWCCGPPPARIPSRPAPIPPTRRWRSNAGTG